MAIVMVQIAGHISGVPLLVASKHIQLYRVSCRSKFNLPGFGKAVAGAAKFFVWLLMDRLNTRNLLKRNHFALPSYNCVLCQGNVEETVEHLFFECPFSEWCWRLMNVQWPQNVSLLDRLALAKACFGSLIFLELDIVAAWCIWTMRNSIIFYGKSPLGRWKISLREELSLCILRCRSTKESLLRDWLFCF